MERKYETNNKRRLVKLYTVQLYSCLIVNSEFVTLMSNCSKTKVVFVGFSKEDFWEWQFPPTHILRPVRSRGRYTISPYLSNWVSMAFSGCKAWPLISFNAKLSLLDHVIATSHGWLRYTDSFVFARKISSDRTKQNLAHYRSRLFIELKERGPKFSDKTQSSSFAITRRKSRSVLKFSTFPMQKSLKSWSGAFCVTFVECSSRHLLALFSFSFGQDRLSQLRLIDTLLRKYDRRATPTNEIGEKRRPHAIHALCTSTRGTDCAKR